MRLEWRLIGELAALIAAPALVDSAFRTLLFVFSKRPLRSEAGSSSGRLLVVVPARDEGRHVLETLSSIAAARAGHDLVRVVLLLDGADEEAEAIARELAIETAVKEPAGPTKARALSWLAGRPEMDGVEAVLILDVGSLVAPDFFTRLRLPTSHAALQTMLRGEGTGVGEAAATSENVAQTIEDRGRSALQWNVRLRGTGTIFRRDAFDYVVPKQVTRVEDLECSLLLSAAGFRIGLLEDAAVFDRKPDDVASAASQRARWILGRYELLFRHPGAFLRLIARKPGEGLAFFSEIFGRPLALTAPLRIAAGALLLIDGQGWLRWFGVVFLLSGLADVVAHVRDPHSARAAFRLLLAWLRAIVFVPRALFRWMRAKRS